MKGQFSHIILLFLCLSVGTSTVAQDISRAALLKIAALEKENIAKNTIDVQAYMLANRLSSRYLKVGEKWAYLKKVEKGIPYYVTTRNIQARTTTGVHTLKQRLGAEFDLQGEGITVGVWDGGQVLTDHVEFDGRVINKNGSSFSNHATHVTGTIAAAGVNANAQGMASKVKVISYYAFQDDLGPMAVEAANGLILSNHSYGLILGWDWNGGWQWYGGSGDKDDRFGHYSSTSATIDDITYNAPYYTIVWAVGNDRNDVGDGTKASDGPYNIIDPSSASKNILSVGAITGFDSYEGSQSAEMSDFSSWGPTNDGRIKPDLVGDGVGVLSTSSSSVNSYVELQGTSMAAPNVAGSLVPIQQYYRQNADTFMTSAALKALVIHTAREAGSKPGPDPQYGWGVLNTEDALKVLRDRNTSDTLFLESKLVDGESYEFEIFSDGITPLRATIAWTDPAGTPGQAGNKSPMLVNDLDMRIYDDDMNEYMPWALNIDNPLKTEKTDNSRDNVEKIELVDPEPRRYLVKINHKGQLVNGEQAFGLILTGGSINVDQGNEYYWVGGAGNMEDASNWADQSGGAALDLTNLDQSTLVFDDNGNLNNSDIIFLNSDLAVANFIWLSDFNGVIDLNGFELSISNNLNILNSNVEFRNGSLKYTSASQPLLDLSFISNDNLIFDLQNTKSLSITSAVNMHSLKLNGPVSINGRNILLNELWVSPQNEPNIANSEITIVDRLQFSGGSSKLNANTWYLDGANIQADKMTSSDLFVFNGSSSLNGNINVGKVTLNDLLSIDHGSIDVDSLIFEAGASLLISPQDTVTINRVIQINGTAANPVSIIGASSSELSFLSMKYRDLLCFDFLTIENMSFLGDAVFNILPSGNLLNSESFFNKECDNLIYPNFTIDLDIRCVNSIIDINNISVGPIIDYVWQAGNGTLLTDPSAEEVQVLFAETGEQNVSLTVSNNSDNVQFTQTIDIVANNLGSVSIVENSSGLVSDKAGINYQWIKDGKIIEGETNRILKPSSPGNYQVAYFVDQTGCPNRISDPFPVLVADAPIDLDIFEEIEVYPNPAQNEVYIKGISRGDVIRIYGINGSFLINEIAAGSALKIDVSGFYQGVYLLEIVGNDFKINKRIIISN